MQSTKLTRIIIVALLVALAIPVWLAAQERQGKHRVIRYTVKDLGTLGGTFSVAGGLNDRGSVEGYSSLPGDTAFHAFFWQNGLMIDLGTLGGPNSIAAYRPNMRGEVGGGAETSTPDPLRENVCQTGTGLECRPYLWQKGVMIPLPTLGGNNGGANGINNRGQVVGHVENTTIDPTCPPPRVLRVEPVLWEKGEVQELPTILDDTVGAAHAINDEGQAVGQSGTCANQGLHALLWQNGNVTDLGNLGGTMNNIGVDINNKGQVVGLSDLVGDTNFHAFLWQNGVMIDLGTLPGDVSSEADGINSSGQVVGGSFDKDGNGRAFVWESGTMTDLNTLIPADSPLFLLEATGAINSRGEIAGIALQIRSGELHAFLATPSNQQLASDSAAFAGQGSAAHRPKVAVPDNVRKMLQHGLAQRYHIPGLGVPRN